MKISGNPLFPTGLRIESVARSIEEMEGQSAFWGLETEQLVPGRYEGRISAVHSGNSNLRVRSGRWGRFFGATCRAAR